MLHMRSEVTGTAFHAGQVDEPDETSFTVLYRGPLFMKHTATVPFFRS